MYIYICLCGSIARDVESSEVYTQSYLVRAACMNCRLSGAGWTRHGDIGQRGGKSPSQHARYTLPRFICNLGAMCSRVTHFLAATISTHSLTLDSA